MLLKDIKEMAKDKGITPGRLRKAELIREIQKTENNTPCFGTCHGDCCETECLWHTDCIKVK